VRCVCVCVCEREREKERERERERERTRERKRERERESARVGACVAVCCSVFESDLKSQSTQSQSTPSRAGVASNDWRAWLQPIDSESDK